MTYLCSEFHLCMIFSLSFYRFATTIVCYTAVFIVVTQRSFSHWGEALRDDTKNGCVADYYNQGQKEFIYWPKTRAFINNFF